MGNIHQLLQKQQVILQTCLDFHASNIHPDFVRSGGCIDRILVRQMTIFTLFTVIHGELVVFFTGLRIPD